MLQRWVHGNLLLTYLGGLRPRANRLHVCWENPQRCLALFLLASYRIELVTGLKQEGM